jgi:hypothetical protein
MRRDAGFVLVSGFGAVGVVSNHRMHTCCRKPSRMLTVCALIVDTATAIRFFSAEATTTDTKGCKCRYNLGSFLHIL